jgi:hypothetical protein
MSTERTVRFSPSFRSVPLVIAQVSIRALIIDPITGAGLAA